MIKRRFLGLSLVSGLCAAGCGGCWDYESCVGGGARGAANPNSLHDDNYYFLRTGIESVQNGYPLNDEEPPESLFEEEVEGPFVPCTPNPVDFEADACEAAVKPPAP